MGSTVRRSTVCIVVPYIRAFLSLRLNGVDAKGRSSKLSLRPFDLRPSVVHSPLSWRPPVHAPSMFSLVSQLPFVSRPPVVDP